MVISSPCLTDIQETGSPGAKAFMLRVGSPRKTIALIPEQTGTGKEIQFLIMADREKGIKREYSKAKTPQQNGVAERRNRTIINATRTMIITTEELGVAAGTISNESASTQGELNADDSSPKEVNAAGQHVNTASLEVNTGHFKLNNVDPSVNTTSSYKLDSPKDMFKLGASHTLKTTHVEFFNDEDEPEVDLGNITNSYTVPTTLNTRICSLISSLGGKKWLEELLQISSKMFAKLVDLPLMEEGHWNKMGNTEGRWNIYQVRINIVAEILKNSTTSRKWSSASTLVDLEKPFKSMYGDADDIPSYTKEIHSLRNQDEFLVILERKPTHVGLCVRCKLWVATLYNELEYVVAGLVAMDKNFLTKGFDAGKDKQIEYLKLNASPLKHVKRGRDTKIPQSSGPPVKVGDEAVHKELGDRMERAATTASSLEAEQDSDAQTRFETTSKQSNDPPLSRVNTLGSREDSMKLMELMAHCTKLSELKWKSTASIVGQVKLYEVSLRRNPQVGRLLKVADEATFTSVDVDAGGAATTGIGLNACQGSGTIHKTPTSPHDSPLVRVLTLGSDEGSLQQNELMDLVTKRRARIVILEDEDAEEDSSKQGRKISDIDKDPTILLVQTEQDMEYDFEISTAEGFTTASVPVTTSSAIPLMFSTFARKSCVHSKKQCQKEKDKDKLCEEDESVQKKSKKQLEQEILGHEEAIRLQEQINEEERQRIARDA
ncbi:putative ribonuclease H-like domain-containing protein [Tanacetum coccineum]|uniref:peroxidase n=1 Tax=Tanacetum coccineum TaxID=301880 RepID=A0ABQ5GEI3_9ASTR